MHFSLNDISCFAFVGQNGDGSVGMFPQWDRVSTRQLAWATCDTEQLQRGFLLKMSPAYCS